MYQFDFDFHVYNNVKIKSITFFSFLFHFIPKNKENQKRSQNEPKRAKIDKHKHFKTQHYFGCKYTLRNCLES